MDKKLAEIIAEQQNVYVDADAEMYTHGKPTDTYGWAPVPQDWIDEAKGE